MWTYIKSKLLILHKLYTVLFTIHTRLHFPFNYECIKMWIIGILSILEHYIFNKIAYFRFVIPFKKCHVTIKTSFIQIRIEILYYKL